MSSRAGVAICIVTVLTACGGGGGDAPPPLALVQELRGVIAALGLTGDPSTGRNLPSINGPLPQLGMDLSTSARA